jgi:outer membrane protein OmpA-like peptidoglycan-associated protein
MGDDEKKVGIAGRSKGKSGAKVGVTARRREPKLTGPKPDDHSVNITGGWEEDDGATLRVNQAGEHIEGWFVRYDTKDLTEIAGDKVGSSFAITDTSSGSRNLGTLHIIDQTTLRFLSPTLRPVGFELRRVDQGAALSDKAILAFPPDVRPKILDAQRRFLTSRDKARTRDQSAASKIGPFIDRFLALPSPTGDVDKFNRAKVLIEIDKHFREKVFDELHPKDHAAAADRIKLELSHQTHKSQGGLLTRSRELTLHAWLNDMLSVADILPRSDLNTFKKLGFSASNTLHHYKFELGLGGVDFADLKDLATKGLGATLLPGLGGGVFKGTLVVKECASLEDGATVLSEFTSKALLFQVGVGAGLSVGSVTFGSTSTRDHWKEPDFDGMLRMVDLSAGAGVDFGICGMFIQGSGAFSELFVDCTGRGWVFGAGVSLSEYVGFIGSKADDKIPVPGETEYSPVTSARTAVHFPFGDAELTSDARQLCRVLAAQELAVFRSGHMRLLSEGHADSVDTVDYNKRLSETRAENTVQALEDILGDDFKARKVDALGLGESEAQGAKEENLKNPVRRRVDVLVNGRLVIKLRGQVGKAP